MPDLAIITAYLRELQDNICRNIESLDGKKFEEDVWERDAGGGGRSRVLRAGNIIEKGGVNFSHVFGPLPEILQKESPAATRFDATGVSLVIHAENPHIPIIHMNVRYFETDAGDWWFGGGIDLTPVYPVHEQLKWFHGQLKEVCSQFDASWYEKMKSACDRYFYIPHREEMRGVGGIFYDHQRAQPGFDKARLLILWKLSATDLTPSTPIW